MSKQDSRQMPERLFGLIKDTLANGKDLLSSGFGKFWVRQKNARQGRKPLRYAMHINKFPRNPLSFGRGQISAIHSSFQEYFCQKV
jgi:nucleoid DNA-binding protein